MARQGYGDQGYSTGFNREPYPTNLQQAAYRTVRSKARAREAIERWTEPLNVQAGVFEGKIVRFLLKCVQEPVSGKRMTEKDRRSLAPVPILRLWVRQCLQNAVGQWHEVDLDITHIDPASLVCEVELTSNPDLPADGMTESIRTQGPIESESAHLYDPSFHPYGDQSLDSSRPPVMSYQSNPGLSPYAPILPKQIFPYDRGPTIPPPIRHRASWTANEHWDTRSAMDQGGSRLPEPPEQTRFRGSDGLESVKGRSRKASRDETSGGDEIDDGNQKSSKKARFDTDRKLFGALHVSGAKVVAPTGEQGLWFLFTDLCINQEGIFGLKFRLFDLTVINPEMPPVPPFVGCESQSFKVYAPRAFPGLPKPSELSEHFMRQGYKLNTRKNERTAKSPSPEPEPIPQPSIHPQLRWNYSSGPAQAGPSRYSGNMDPPPPPPQSWHPSYYDR